jgi:hypothetical protein
VFFVVVVVRNRHDLAFTGVPPNDEPPDMKVLANETTTKNEDHEGRFTKKWDVTS